MVKHKLFIILIIFMTINRLSAFPFTISPNITFQVLPVKSEIIKFLWNENYQKDKLENLRINDFFLNINLSGLNTGYNLKTEKNKIKNNYVKLNYRLELVSNNNLKFTGEIYKIEIHSGNNVSVINDDISFSEMKQNLYNKNYYSCTTKTSIIEFPLDDPSGYISILVFLKIDGYQKTIKQKYQIIQKKHLIQLKD